MKNKTKFISQLSIFIALTIVLTLALVIPLPSNGGYLNLSDAMILTSSSILGPYGGLIVGAFSGAICDLASGYAIYAPFTFIIKGIEGFLAGFLLKKFNGIKTNIISLFICGILMGILYFIPDLIIYGSSVAIFNLPLNILQGLVGALISSLVYMIFLKKH